MDIKITFRGMEKDAALEQHINQQLGRLQEFIDKEHGPAHLEFVIAKNAKFPNFSVSARLQMPRCSCVASHEGADAYAEINKVCDRIHTHVVNCKAKLVDDKKHGCDGECRDRRYKRAEAEEEANAGFIDLSNDE